MVLNGAREHTASLTGEAAGAHEELALMPVDGAANYESDGNDLPVFIINSFNDVEDDIDDDDDFDDDDYEDEDLDDDEDEDDDDYDEDEDDDYEDEDDDYEDEDDDDWEDED